MQVLLSHSPPSVSYPFTKISGLIVRIFITNNTLILTYYCLKQQLMKAKIKHVKKDGNHETFYTNIRKDNVSLI